VVKTGPLLRGHPTETDQPGRKRLRNSDPTTTPPSFVQAFALPSNCIPHGLALGPHPNAIVGCSTPAAGQSHAASGTQIIS